MNHQPYSNNFIIGGSDPLLNKENLQLKISEYLRMLNQMSIPEQQLQAPKEDLLWDKINSEIEVLSDSLKEIIFNDEEYQLVNILIQQLVQLHIINIVKEKIELTPNGQKILLQQYELVLSLKKKAINDSNKEMLLFKLFREFSKENPNVTYDQFIKNL